MPDIAAVLRQEIARLARKEVRREFVPLKKSLVESRRKVSALKREVAALQRTVTLLETRAVKSAVEKPNPAPETKVRYSARWAAADRKRLGLSAKDYGRLVGVSGQTIYAWESGKAKPRAERLAAWAAVRGIGKREARRQLELLKREDEAQKK